MVLKVLLANDITRQGGSGGGQGGGNNIQYPPCPGTPGQGHDGGNVKRGVGYQSGGGGYSAMGGSILDGAGGALAGFNGGGGGILKWHLPNTVRGTDDYGMTNFAAGGGGWAGRTLTRNLIHGGAIDGYGAGGNSQEDGKGGAILIRYAIMQ